MPRRNKGNKTLTREEQIAYLEPFIHVPLGFSSCRVLAILTDYNASAETLDEYEVDEYETEHLHEVLDMFLSQLCEPNERYRRWNIILDTLGFEKVRDVLVENPEKYIDDLEMLDDAICTLYTMFSRIS